MPENTTVEKTIRDAEEAAFRYFDITNNTIGLLSFNAGLACISTESPQMYAFITMIFIVFVWYQNTRSLDRRLRMLRNIKHKVFSLLSVLSKSPIALIDWLFLALIGMGRLTTKGISM